MTVGHEAGGVKTVVKAFAYDGVLPVGLPVCSAERLEAVEPSTSYQSGLRATAGMLGHCSRSADSQR
jgi:hypothetical protein